MKSTQLLSVVFSLIMFTGVTAGNTAFAETDDDLIEDFEDCVEAGYPIMESFPEQCMTDDGTVFVNDEDDDDDDDEIEDKDRYGLDDRLEDFCEMTDEEKLQLFADHPRLEQFSDRLTNYCNMDENEREDALENFIDEHEDELRKYHDEDIKEKLSRYCEMSDEDKRTFIEEHDKTEDHVAKMNKYCELDENDRINFIAEHRDEYKAHMKDKMMNKKHHMDYDRLCTLTESDRVAEIDDSEKLDRISEWCEMTPEEREEYKMKHKDAMKDKIKDMPHDFDRMSDVAKDRMSDVAKDKLASKMKMSDMSDRLKTMIMDKRVISDEKRDEIRMKYQEKYGDLDTKKSELKMEFKKHMKSMKVSISDERKSSIHDRVSEMKAFKADLRERSSELTDEEKQQLREDFIKKVKDMQLAWISPRIQMTAGIDATEVECREGFSLVMKASNGVAMCLKADSALKMIDRGIVVPAN